jgi:glutathione S-transferase
VGFAGTYRLLDKPSQAIFDVRLPAMGVDLGAIERLSAEEKRARVAAGLDGLATAIDAQGGQGGHVVGDSITFADLAVAAFVEFFRVSTGEREHILTLNGGRWKRLLDEIRA